MGTEGTGADFFLGLQNNPPGRLLLADSACGLPDETCHSLVPGPGALVILDVSPFQNKDAALAPGGLRVLPAPSWGSGERTGASTPLAPGGHMTEPATSTCPRKTATDTGPA